MISLNSDTLLETNDNLTQTTPLKVARIASLLHQLHLARDANDQLIPLLAIPLHTTS